MQRHGDDFHGHHRGRTKKWPRSSADVAPVPGATAVPASQTTTARPQTSTAAARRAAAWRPSLPTACPCLMESKAMWLYCGNVSNAWRVGKKKNRGQDWIVRVQFHSNNRWSYYTGIATFFFRRQAAVWHRALRHTMTQLIAPEWAVYIWVLLLGPGLPKHRELFRSRHL